jgi:amino acid permease
MPDQTPDTRFSWLPLGSLALAVIAVIILYFKGGDPMDHLKIIAGYTILILVFFYGLMVLIGMANGTIDLKFLVSEGDGHASMSRFQLLIFTFVIGLSLFLIVVAAKPPKFPAIPKEILTLLGISATTYAAGKAIQFSRPNGGKAADAPAPTGADPKTAK